MLGKLGLGMETSRKNSDGFWERIETLESDAM